MITLERWVSSDNKYPERAKSPELTDLVKANATTLLASVNALLEELSIDVDKLVVSSGFRPSSVNAKLANAAKKSLHMTGLAVDILDPTGSLSSKIIAKPNLLKKHNLWIENPFATPTWCHLDMGKRSDRPIRMFTP